MGKVADNTIQGIRHAAHDDVLVEHLFTGYLRRKIGYKTPSTDIAVAGERGRLCDKTQHLTRAIPSQSVAAVERVLARFLENVDYHRAHSVASRDVKLSTWGEMFAQHIDASFNASEITLSTEAFLYSIIDIKHDAQRNLDRMQGSGTALVKRVVLYKELVQDCVVAHDFTGRVEELLAAKIAAAAGAFGGDAVMPQVIVYEAHIQSIVNADAGKR